MLRELTRLNRQMDASLRQFGLLGALGVGAAIHAGQNLVTKGLLKSKRGQRVLASIAQAGHRDAKQGKVLHPMVQRSADMLIGPEYSHLYKAGGNSTRVQRLVAAARAKMPGNDEAGQVARIIAGPRSKRMDALMKKMPRIDAKVAATPKSKWLGRAAAAVTGAGAAMVEPVMPLINGGRALLAKHPWGDALIRKAGMAGLKGKKAGGVSRAVTDLLGSPMLSQAQNAVYHGLKPLRAAASKFGAGEGQQDDAADQRDLRPGEFLTMLHQVDGLLEFALLKSGYLVERPPLRGGGRGWNRHGGGKERPIRLFRPVNEADMPRTAADAAQRKFNPQTDVHLDYLRHGRRLREVDVMSAPEKASPIRSGRAISKITKPLLDNADRRKRLIKTTANAYGHKAVPSEKLAEHYGKMGFVDRKAKVLKRVQVKNGITAKDAETMYKGAIPMVRLPRH